MSARLPDDLARFLDANAAALDEETALADTVVPVLGASGLLRAGVPESLGGAGSPRSAAVLAIAAVAERSLAAAFVFWGQRAFIEYLVQSTNLALRERWLGALLAGRFAGATGLSNAMKYLSGIEALGIHAETQHGAAPGARRYVLEGHVPWATNLRREGFAVAVAVARGEQGTPFVAALPFDRPGLVRSADLDLIALRGTNTASLAVRDLLLDESDVIAADARVWLPRVRPAFLALQCALSMGLARASLAAARERCASARAVLADPIERSQRELEAASAALLEGLDHGRFVDAPAPLFELRIRLAAIALEAVQIELQASGGRAYHRDQPLGFARRWREAAFLPIVTPSLTQLQGELLRHRARSAAAPA